MKVKLKIIGCCYKTGKNKYQNYYCNLCEFQKDDDACKLVTLHEKDNDIKIFIYGEADPEGNKRRFNEYWNKRKSQGDQWIIFGANVAGTEIGNTLENMLESGM